MKTPATVVTGFLGAGKTTLIRHLVAHANGRRLALIVNEFGDLGIDREMLLGCGLEGCSERNVVELTNGCICCTVADEFLPTIEMVMDQPAPPDHVIIETSGLALPKPLVKAFNWPEIRSRVTVDGVIAVIDAPAVADGRFAEDPEAVQAERETDMALAHDSPLAELFEDQLICADMVILNKTDLVKGARLDAIRAEIGRTLRPETKVLSAAHGIVDPMVVLGLVAAVEDDIGARPSHHDGSGEAHDHDDFTSFVAELGPVSDPAALEHRIRAIAVEHDVLRVKGFLHVPGKDMRHVIQAVGGRVHRYYDRRWQADEERSSRLVVIGRKGLDDAAVRAAFDG